MVRALKEKDLGMIGEWWQMQTGSKLCFDLLSDSGFLYEDIAAMWFFPLQGSKLAFFGWPIANPNSTKAGRAVAFAALIGVIEAHAMHSGYKFLTTYSSRGSVSEKLEAWGFQVGDNPVTQYIKNLEVNRG